MKVAKYSAGFVLIGLLAACAESQIVHEYLTKGQVVGIDGGEMILCIGSREGAREGHWMFTCTPTMERLRKEEKFVGEITPVKLKLNQLWIGTFRDIYSMYSRMTNA